MPDKNTQTLSKASLQPITAATIAAFILFAGQKTQACKSAAVPAQGEAASRQVVRAGTNTPHWCGTELPIGGAARDDSCFPAIYSPCSLDIFYDDPTTRDSFLVSDSSRFRTVRLNGHYFTANDNGASATISPEQLETAKWQLRRAFERHRIDFDWTVYGHVDLDYVIGIEVCDDWGPMREDYAVNPQTACNVYFVKTLYIDYNNNGVNEGGEGLAGRALFPWLETRYTSMDGLAVQSWDAARESRNVLVHEMGHCLGLWHTHFGSSSVGCDSECYEGVDQLGMDEVGDHCSDTLPEPYDPPSESNNGEGYSNNWNGYQNGPDPSWPDTCSAGDPFWTTIWNGAARTNYMSYSPEYSFFSPQQAARMHAALEPVSGEASRSQWVAQPSPPPNSSCATPFALAAGISGSLPYRVDNIDANLDGPSIAGLPIASDTWFSYTSTQSGDVTVTVKAWNFDPFVAIYTDKCPSPESHLALNWTNQGLRTDVERTTQVVLPNVLAGQTFTIRVGGTSTVFTEGLFEITVDLPVVADYFDDNQIDTSLWTRIDIGPVVHSVTEQNGRLEFQTSQNNSGFSRSLFSNNGWRLDATQDFRFRINTQFDSPAFVSGDMGLLAACWFAGDPTIGGGPSLSGTIAYHGEDSWGTYIGTELYLNGVWITDDYTAPAPGPNVTAYYSYDASGDMLSISPISYDHPASTIYSGLRATSGSNSAGVIIGGYSNWPAPAVPGQHSWLDNFVVDEGALIYLCPADLTNDGLLDLADVIVFVTAFTSGDLVVDLAEPHGLLDLADIVAFASAFNAGCP